MRTERGQSIVEYLAVLTALIASFLAVQAQMRKSADALYTSGKDQVDRAATGLNSAQLTDGKVWN